MSDIEMVINKADVDKLMKKLDEKQRDAAIRQSLWNSIRFLQGWIMNNRLSGPRPAFLGVVTDRLRSSITVTKPEKIGNNYQATVGTNVIYARIHEYGGIINMPAMTRAVAIHEYKRRGIKFVKAGSKRMTGTLTYDTKAYTINMPARPFMRPAVEDEDNRQAVINDLEKEVNKILKA